MHRNIRSLIVISAASIAAAGQAQTRYSVTELAPLPGMASSNAVGINDLGDVVGSCNAANSSWSEMATVWRKGVPSALGRAPKGNYSYASSINNNGQIAGDADDGDFRPQSVTFTKGSALFIDSGSNNSHAFTVLKDGTIVGNYLKGFGGTSAWNPTIWKPDLKKPGQYKHTFLPQFVEPNGGFSNVYANAANKNGVVVGQVSASTLWSSRGGIWANDATHTLSLLSPLPGEWDSYATAINDKGLIAGISDTGIYSQTPVTWSPDAAHTVQKLQLLPGELTGWVTGINNLGQVIGWHGPNSAPAVWIQRKLIDLQSALDASGDGWTISTVSQINNLGQIVGSGFHNGQFRGFILSPVAQP